MRILIVEDEKALADIIKKGLEEEGYAVDVAYNGEDGLFMAENEPSDIIILDIMLPLVDGMTILKKIRGERVRTPVPCIPALPAAPASSTSLCVLAAGGHFRQTGFCMGKLVSHALFHLTETTCYGHSLFPSWDIVESISSWFLHERNLLVRIKQ